MNLQALVDGVLRGEVRPIPAQTEAEYHAAWLHHAVGALDPSMMAILGGALADRLAWVFVAGYQGTIRHCFPDLPPEDGWSSFVNTEDQSRTLPGTSLTGEPSNRHLSGWKTWVAASEHVERLLVSARQGETPFVVVRRDQPGVRIESGESKAYLSEMTQGRAEFTDVSLQEDQLVGDERTFPVFRSAESAYVRAALNAFIFSYACRLGGGSALIGQALAGVYAAAAILHLPLPSPAVAVAILGFDLCTTALARKFAAFIETDNPSLHGLWMKDQRLITGAASGIATRASEALAHMAQIRPA